MKLLKGLVCAFALAFTAILLTGCSAKAEKLNEVAKEAMKAMEDVEGYKLNFSMSGSGEEDGKKSSGKISVKISANKDGEMTYSVKVNTKEDGKKTSIKESGVIIKEDNAVKVYVNHKSNIDGNKEEYKKVYTALSTELGLLYVNDYVTAAEGYYLMLSAGLNECANITQEVLDEDNEKEDYKASSFLGTYKLTVSSKEDDEESKIIVKFNKKGVTGGSIEEKEKDGKAKIKLSVSYKEVKVKAPSGDYTAA